MTNQTPAELREAARFAARQIPRDDIEAARLRTLAEAARRLADVIDWALDVENRGADYEAYAMAQDDALTIARGETERSDT